MMQEDRILLLKDLSARLPYGVKCIVTKSRIEEGQKGDVGKIVCVCLEGVDCIDISFFSEFGNFKPYLFPLSTMTDEQKEELFKLCEFYIQEDWEGKKSEAYGIEIASRFDPAYCYDHNFNLWSIDMRAIDWLNAHHFDYRGLIEKGLAIDATNKNIY